MDRFMVMTIIFMSLILPRLLFLKLFWLHRYLSSGQTCLETECVGFKPAACVNWSFCLFPPKGRLCSMLWDDRPVQQQNVCSEGDPTEQGVQTTPERQGTRSPIFVSPVSCITGNQCLGCCFFFWDIETSSPIDELSFVDRLRTRSSCTERCHTSMWWNSPTISRTKKTSTSSSSCAVGRWDFRTLEQSALLCVLLALTVFLVLPYSAALHAIFKRGLGRFLLFS